LSRQVRDPAILVTRRKVDQVIEGTPDERSEYRCGLVGPGRVRVVGRAGGGRRVASGGGDNRR